MGWRDSASVGSNGATGSSGWVHVMMVHVIRVHVMVMQVEMVHAMVVLMMVVHM